MINLLAYSQRAHARAVTMMTRRPFSGACEVGSIGAKIEEQISKLKVAPSAKIYLHRYGILPQHVTSTGPLGHLTKTDVIGYAKKLNLQLLDLKKPASSFIKTEDLKLEA